MRLVIAGGGTGGHTSAGLAVAAALARQGPMEIHWVGSRHGLEARRVPAAGLPFHAVPAGKLRRYWDWQNLPDLGCRFPAGVVQSWWLLRRLQPDLLFATGGFVSLPPALAARALGIPVVVHEQTAVPGLANRITSRFAKRIALTFPQTDRGLPVDRVAVTGNPIRPELLGGSRQEALRLFGFDPACPLLYVTGGSQGSHRINRTVGETLARLLERCQVVHQAGDNRQTGDLGWLAERQRTLPEALRLRYALRAWVGAELAHVYAGADLVLGRSGAGTVNECCHLGLPAIYVPLPGSSGDEQTANARVAAEAGAALLLPQARLTPERLLETVAGLLGDPERLRTMAERARSLAVPEAADRLARVILEAAAP